MTLSPSKTPDYPFDNDRGNGPTLRILVAEDNPVNQKVMRAMLERLGHQPDVAENGREAVEAFETKQYDIVLMDIQMPEMDGYEATKVLRQQFPKGTLRIVAVTANAMPEDERRCLDAGMDDYVAKPVTVPKLMAALEFSRTVEADGTEAVDPKVLDDLSMAIGSERTNDVLDTYVTSSTAIIEEMAEKKKSGQGQELATLAHRLRGSSGVVGAGKLAELCAVLDAQARLSNDATDLQPVNAEFERVKAALAAYQACSTS